MRGISPSVVFGRPGLVFSLLAAWLAAEARASENVILDWNAVMMAAIRLDNSGPTLSTRNLALLNLAMYDAVNSIRRSHQPYGILPNPPPGASAEAAAVAAGHEVMVVLYPGLKARADEALALWEAGDADDVAREAGLQFGREIARETVGSRSGDGSATDVPYIPSNEPGQWRRTPPFFRPPLTPGWRYVRPFAIRAVEPFVPPPPPALDSAEYAEALEVVRRLGRRDSVERTAEQSQIAVFWSDFSYTAMPPGHWHEIAASIARGVGLGLEESARLMALLSLAQADGAIVCWEAKYRYNLWRPVTAIQRADEDGNPATDKDATWDHFLAAPPFPAYTSGHSTFSQASAEVLAVFLGTDAVEFTAISDSLPGVFRAYHSLRDCAAEVGMSRIYGGIHFPFDNREGKRCGARVARWVTDHWLLPNDQLPLARIERREDGAWEVGIHGKVGTRIVLEVSSDLRDWRVVSTNEARPGGCWIPVEAVMKPEAGQSQFFRVREGAP